MVKDVFKIALLAALLLFAACHGDLIVEAGVELTCLWPVAGADCIWGVYALCGLYGLSLLVLALPLMLRAIKAITSEQPLSWRTLLFWFVLLFLIYFSADIVDKGAALNELTPYPLLGWLFWAFIAVFVLWQVVLPIVSFVRLTSMGKLDDLAHARRALHDSELLRYRSAESCHTDEEHKRHRLYRELSNALGNRDKQALPDLLRRYREMDDMLPARARKLIFSYCQVAGLSVVISRNKWLDGLALIFLQLRLVIALARMYGGKPSPVFNTLCFAAIILNSFIYIILNSLSAEKVAEVSAALAGEFADLLLDDPEVEYKAATSVSEGLPFVGGMAKALDVVINPLLEASLAGANVYVTGRLFLCCLEGGQRPSSFGDIVRLRRQGRLELVRKLFTPLNARFAQKFKRNLPTAGLNCEPEPQAEKL